MGAISSVNVLGNSIGVEQAQELIKILQAKEKLTTLCGFSGDETELDLSNKNLSAGCAVLVANDISDMGAISSVDVTKNDIAFTTTLFDLFADLSMKNQQVQISCKEGNKWGEEACFYEAMFDEDILSSSEKKEKVDLRERGLQGLIPWGFIVHMIRHRGLRALLLGRNEFQAYELPHGLDLNGLEELDLSGNGSLGGKKMLALYLLGNVYNSWFSLNIFEQAAFPSRPALGKH